MANEGGNNEVGSISFGIRADTTQFVADLKRAEQAAKHTSQVIGQEAKVIQTSMTGPNLAGVAPGGFMVGPGLGGGGGGGGRAGGGGSAAASAASAAAVASVAGAMGNGARDAARFNDEVKKSKGLIDDVGRSARGAILPFTRLLGVVGLVTGAFTALVKVGSTITSIFDSAADRANRFKDGLSSLAAVANRAAVAQDIETTAARIEKLRAIVNDNSFLGSLERVGRFLIGQGTSGQMNQEVERLQRLERELRARLHAFELEERRSKRQQDYEEARKKSVQAVIDLQREAHRMAEELDEDGLTQAERIEKKYQKIMEMVRDLRGLGQDAAADRLEESARRSRERELRALAEAMAKEFREVGKEITDDMRAIFRDLSRSVVADIRAIGPKLDLINRGATRFAGRG